MQQYIIRDDIIAAVTILCQSPLSLHDQLFCENCVVPPNLLFEKLFRLVLIIAIVKKSCDNTKIRGWWSRGATMRRFQGAVEAGDIH